MHILPEGSLKQASFKPCTVDYTRTYFQVTFRLLFSPGTVLSLRLVSSLRLLKLVCDAVLFVTTSRL